MWSNSVPEGYDRSTFKINDVQRRQLKKVIKMLDAEAEEDDPSPCAADDADSLRNLLRLLEDGHIQDACKHYARMDTACREYAPQWMAELADCGINPTWWRIEESFEVTTGLVDPMWAAPPGDTAELKAKVLDQIWHHMNEPGNFVCLPTHITNRIKTVYDEAS